MSFCMRIINKIYEGDPLPVIKIEMDGVIKTFYLVENIDDLKIKKNKVNKKRKIKCEDTGEIFDDVKSAVEAYGPGVVNVLYKDAGKPYKGMYFNFID